MQWRSKKAVAAQRSVLVKLISKGFNVFFSFLALIFFSWFYPFLEIGSFWEVVIFVFATNLFELVLWFIVPKSEGCFSWLLLFTTMGTILFSLIIPGVDLAFDGWALVVSSIVAYIYAMVVCAELYIKTKTYK